MSQVTIANQGRTPNPFAFGGSSLLDVQRLVVNRDGESKRKSFRRVLKESIQTQGDWDMVVDFTAFQPHHVQDVVESLSGHVGLYICISTDSIYEVCKPPSPNGNGRLPRTESDNVLLELPRKKLRNMDVYGYDKWKCGQALFDEEMW